MGKALRGLGYSAICSSEILLRLLKETKMLLAVSNAQISGTMASLAIVSLGFVKDFV